MRSSVGPPVVGEDFFDRETELRQLAARIRDGNHVLLTGQRRMGKTSIAQELGARLEQEGWVFLYIDVEGETSEEAMIANLAEAVHPVRAVSSRLARSMKEWVGKEYERVEEISASVFAVKVRSGLNQVTWRRRGRDIIRYLADHDASVLVVIDEFPIFLTRLSKLPDGRDRVEGLLSWIRAVLQESGRQSPVVMLSGSIGLVPLVSRLGLPDRINYLDEFRLGPWDRKTCVRCIERLAAASDLDLAEGVADAVYDRLGLGVPHHVQSFFGKLRDLALAGSERITITDVADVYRTKMLGPAGEVDFLYYEKRLHDALADDRNFEIAMTILAEAATHDLVTLQARNTLERHFAQVVTDARPRVALVLDILVHDGYLERDGPNLAFRSKWLKDWWSVRFGNYEPSHGAPLPGPR